MTRRLQALRKLGISGLAGIALLGLAFCCFTPARASASGHGRVAHRTIRRTLHPVRHYPKSRSRAPVRRVTARMRTVSYKVPKRKRPIPYHKPYRRPRYRRVYRRRWYHHVTLPREPGIERTEQIQSALARGGYYSADPNGRWDSRTQNALRRFQEANGLPPTGKLDALSLQKLGLGSDVAGVSAPGPVTYASQTASSDSR